MLGLGQGKTYFATKLKEEGWKVLTDKNFDSKFSEVLKDRTARVIIGRIFNSLSLSPSLPLSLSLSIY
jgi:hypothetical protein